MNVQIVCASQLNQFIATSDVAAVEAAIRDVPCIIFAVMQSDCESLFLQFGHCVIAFRVLWIHSDSNNEHPRDGAAPRTVFDLKSGIGRSWKTSALTL
jgi:hypothetical protein